MIDIQYDQNAVQRICVSLGNKERQLPEDKLHRGNKEKHREINKKGGKL